jgi:hypothetical protein
MLGLYLVVSKYGSSSVVCCVSMLTLILSMHLFVLDTHLFPDSDCSNSEPMSLESLHVHTAARHSVPSPIFRSFRQRPSMSHLRSHGVRVETLIQITSPVPAPPRVALQAVSVGTFAPTRSLPAGTLNCLLLCYYRLHV